MDIQSIFYAGNFYVFNVQSCSQQVIEVDPSVAPIVEQANMVKTSYIVSFIKLFAKTQATGIMSAPRRFFLEYVYANMGRFARKSWEDWCIPHGSLFEIGVALDV